MSYLIMKTASNATPESFQLTSTINPPRIVVNGSYIPLTTNSGGGNLKWKIVTSNTTYYAMRTSTSSYSRSASASATFNTTAAASAGLSSTTALTRASTSATLTRASTSATLTRASTSATLTRASTSATLTRASTSATLTRASTYETLTRASTYAWNTTATQWDISSSITCSYTYGTGGPGWAATNTRYESYIQHIFGTCTYTETRNNNMSLLSGSFTRSESYTWQIPGSGNVISSSTVASKNTFLHNGTYGGPNVYSFTWSANYTYLADALTRESIYGYNTRESVSGYATRESVSGYATRESVSGYGTRSSVSAYGTRSSVSGYGTRASTSGYSGVSSSSSSSSESASGTCWR